MRDVLTALGLAPRDGNYETVWRRIGLLGLDVSHFPMHGKQTLRAYSDEEILQAVKISRSFAQVLSTLGIQQGGEFSQASSGVWKLSESIFPTSRGVRGERAAVWRFGMMRRSPSNSTTSTPGEMGSQPPILRGSPGAGIWADGGLLKRPAPQGACGFESHPGHSTASYSTRRNSAMATPSRRTPIARTSRSSSPIGTVHDPHVTPGLSR
jgi:hypothetical protein